MKKLLAAAALLALTAAAFAQGNDPIVKQYDPTASYPMEYVISKPAGGANGVHMYDGASKLQFLATLDPSIVLSGTTLTVDLSAYTTSASLATLLTSYATTSALTSGLSGKFNTPTGTTAQYLRGDGSLATLPAPGTGTVTSVGITSSTLNVIGSPITTSGSMTVNMPNTGTAGTYNSVTTDAQGRVTAGTNTPFNFSQPSARTLAVSTSYQASDPSKAAVIYPSYACTNATQVLASSACTLQVRMGTSALSCSTGTVYHSQSLTVNLGVLLTQNSTNPVPIFLPIGGHFIICPTAGTFTVSTVEQTAG